VHIISCAVIVINTAYIVEYVEVSFARQPDVGEREMCTSVQQLKFSKHS